VFRRGKLIIIIGRRVAQVGGEHGCRPVKTENFGIRKGAVTN